MKKTAAILLVLAMVLSFGAFPALATDRTEDVVYVLMNIPYEEFYAAELGENGTADAVSGATLKYANSGIAGGSYHDVDAADADSQVEALGVVYPVLVDDLSKLDESLKVTDETTKTIGIVSGREKTITPTEVIGKDALFCAPSYSWYALSEAPARYKTLSADESGAFSFSAVSGSATAVKDVTGAASYYTHHGNYVEIRLSGLTIDENVSGVIVTFDDGTSTALPHIQGFWQKTQIGWADNAVAGKTVTGLKYITAENVYTAEVNIPVKLDGGAITAAFEDANTLTVTGLPEDIANPAATVQTQVGRGETPTVIAENVKVENGRIITADPAVEGTTYTVSITSDNYADASTAAKYSTSAGEDFLSQVKGEYQPLFDGATFNKEYDHYWHDYTAAVVGGSAADDMVAYMKSSIGAKGYGEQADAPNFFCGFTGDVATIRFGGEDGKTVTFTKEDGSTVTCTYEFVKEADATGKYGDYDMAMSGYLYKAQEENADQFRYLLMFPDTPDTTYHLEFRYADTEENVEKLLEGPYAYWVGSAIQTSALTEKNEDTLQKVISLFVVENLVEMASDETDAQRAGLVGTWDCDFSAFPDYANAKMYIVLSADGTGKTYADFTGTGEPALTAEYTFFAYDPDKTDGKDGGTYISLNPAAETVTPGAYEVKTIDGKKALVFTSNEGEITYYIRAAESSRFTDVPADAYYAPAVDWAAANEITKGTSDTTFNPNDPCTREQVVTFLWRAAGSPEPKTTSCPFTDVTENYAYKAILWAAENGITKGTSDTTFSPKDTCTREQFVTFLWRYEKSPEPTSKNNPFTDVKENFAYKAILWAVENEITKGTSDTTFGPSETCKRAHVVTFLYRDLA